MPTVYFDSSAFVKLLLDEPGSELAAALWDGCDAAASSRLAYPEVRAAIAAASRDFRLSASDARRANRIWADLWDEIRSVELTDGVADHAGQLAAEHALNGVDAVHLASALLFGGDNVVFAAWDRRRRAGAFAAGLLVAPIDTARPPGSGR